MLIVCPACASEYEIDATQVGSEGRAVRCAACRQTWFVAPVASAPERADPDGTVPEDGPARTLPEQDSDGLPPRSEPAQERAGGPVPGAPASATLGADPEAARAEPAAGASDPEAGARRPTVIDQPVPPRRVRERVRGGDGPSASRAGRTGWTGLPGLSPAVAAGLVVFVLAPLALLGRTTLVAAMPRSAGLFAAVGLPVNLRGIDIRDVAAFRTPPDAGRPAELVVEGDLVGTARARVAVEPLEIEVRDARDRPLMRWTAPAPRAALEPGETARFRASLPGPPLQGAEIEVRFAGGQSFGGLSSGSRVAEGRSGAARPAGESPAAAPSAHRAAEAASSGH